MKRLLCVAAVAAALCLATAVVAESEAAPYSYADALRSLNFARTTYCAAPSIASWSCGPLCDGMPGFQLYAVMRNETAGALGFAGVDTVHQQIVLAFRGSVELANYIEDSLAFLVPYSSNSCGTACKVHDGFYLAYLSLQSQVRAAVTALLSRYPGYGVLVTGHSLGGALAVLAAVDVKGQLNQQSGSSATAVGLYSFGCPRVGNAAFASWTSAMLAGGPHYRVTHACDPVPQTPKMSAGFLHAPTEVFYSSSDNSSMVICDDSGTGESEACRNAKNCYNLLDHVIYLGKIALCVGAV